MLGPHGPRTPTPRGLLAPGPWPGASTRGLGAAGGCSGGYSSSGEWDGVPTANSGAHRRRPTPGAHAVHVHHLETKRSTTTRGTNSSREGAPLGLTCRGCRGTLAGCRPPMCLHPPCFNNDRCACTCWHRQHVHAHPSLGVPCQGTPRRPRMRSTTTRGTNSSREGCVAAHAGGA